MQIIIVGCGKVGYTLVQQLSGEAHNSVVVDIKEDRVRSITDELDAMGVIGNGTSFQTLLEAGIKHADLLIAVTNSDEQNLLCCVIAKKAGNCKTIARVRNPIYNTELEFLRKELGLAMIINPELASASEIARIFQFPSAIKIDTFAKGRIEMLHFKITEDCKLNNYGLIHIRTTLKCEVLVCTVTRGDRVIIPRGDFIFKEGDMVAIVATPSNANDFFRKIGINIGRIHTAMLVGGGRVAHYLGEILLSAGIHIKIIDDDLERCKFLTEELPGASVIFGDRSSQQLLMSEGMTEMDALVTLSADDELNVITSLYGAAIKVPHVVTRVNHLDTGGMLDSLDIGSLVSPKELCSTNIVQYVRAMQNQTGAAVTLHRIAGGKAEALEFVIGDDAMNVNVPLKDFRLRKNIILACITRNGDTIIPDGNSTFHLGDTVIIVNTREEPILHFNEIFA